MTIPGSMGELYGVLKLPEAEGPVPLILLSHGFGGSHGPNQVFADAFTDAGFATFNFDFCGGGTDSRSAGSFLEMSVLTEARDLSAVIDRFLTDDRFDRIILWGASQGGFVSSYVAGKRPSDVAALVLHFPAYVLQDDAKKRAEADGTFPETSSVMGITIGRRYNEDAVSFDIYDVLPAYTGPVLIQHGDSDRIVPLAYSRRAKEAFPNAVLTVYPGQGHGFDDDARSDSITEAIEWLRAVLK